MARKQHPPLTPKKKKKREKRCRKNIATLLSLMGFHDDDPDATVEIMLGKLRDINEKSTTMMIDYDETDQSVEPKPKRLKIVMTKKVVDTDTPKELSEELKDFIKGIGGSESEFVIEKQLTCSDVTSNQGRLLIPELQLKKGSGFLTGDEKRKLEAKEDVEVCVYDPRLRESTLNLARWKMKNGNYVLKKKWNEIVRENNLEENMVMQVWSFRVGHQQQLCFALVRIHD